MANPIAEMFCDIYVASAIEDDRINESDRNCLCNLCNFRDHIITQKDYHKLILKVLYPVELFPHTYIELVLHDNSCIYTRKLSTVLW